MVRRKDRKTGEAQSIRPKGAGVYTYVEGQEIVDGDDDAAATGEADPSAGQLETRAKRKETMPGTGARAWSGRPASKLTKPGTGASVWKASEPPKPKDTWPGTGGPADRALVPEDEPNDAPPSEPSSAAKKRERSDTMPGPKEKGAEQPKKTKLARIKKTLIGTGAGIPASDRQPVSMPLRGAGAPHDRALPFDAVPDSPPGDRTSSVPPQDEVEPASRAKAQRNKATKPAMRAARERKPLEEEAAAAEQKTKKRKKKAAPEVEREVEKKTAPDDEVEREVEKKTAPDDEVEREVEKKTAPDDEVEREVEKKTAPDDEVERDSEDEVERGKAAAASPPRESQPPSKPRPQTIAGVPAKWALAAIIAVSLAFVVGIFMSSGPISIRIGSDGERGSAPAPRQPADRPLAAEPTAASTAEQAASTAEPDRPPPADDDDGSGLPANQGYLLVEGPTDKLYVYARGARLGPTGEKLQLACGLVHVRLGDRAPEHWYSAVQPVRVTCRSVTKVTIEPSAPVRLSGKAKTASAPPATPYDEPPPAAAPPPTAPPKPPPPPPQPKTGTAFVPDDL